MKLFQYVLKIIAIFILATVVMGFIGMSSNGIVPTFFYLIFYLAGVRIAANAFPELRNSEKSSFWLMIPGSNFEKYFSRLILSSVGFIILYSILFFVGVNIGNVINIIVFNRFPAVFIPIFWSRHINRNSFLFYFTFNFFLQEGLYFKKYPIIKTVLFVLMIIVLLMVCVSVIGGIAFFI